MSYVVENGLLGLAGVSTNTASLDSLLNYVKNNRDFVSKLVVKWLDLDRGLSYLPGYEKGVSKGGVKKTKVGSTWYDLTKAYDVLKQSSNRSKPQYDTMRAAALATILKRDMAHVAHAATQVSSSYKNFSWNSLFGLAGAAFSSLSSSLIQSFVKFTAPFSPTQLKNIANSLLSVHSKAKKRPSGFFAGLGVYTKNNHSIHYYENPSYIQFSDTAIKNIYVSLREADMSFQLVMKPISDLIVACLGPINLLLLSTGKQFSAEDIKNIMQVPFPTAGIAIMLEPLSANFRITSDFWNKVNFVGRQILFASGVYGVLGTIVGILAAVGAAPTLGVSVAALGTIAGVLGGTAAAGGVIGGIMLALSENKQPPSKQDFRTSLTWGAKLTLKPEPTAAQIDKWYCDLLRSYGKPCAPAATVSTPAKTSTTTSRVSPTAALTSSQPLVFQTKKEGSLVWTLAIGVSAGLLYVWKARRAK